MVSKNGRYVFCLSRVGRSVFAFQGLAVIRFCPLRTGRFTLGLAGFCQGTGRYVFLPFKDWQVLLLPFKELACKHTAFQANGQYTFSAF